MIGILLTIIKLEAKWYLEHQLAQKRKLRAPRGGVTATETTKRKLDLMQDEAATCHQDEVDESPAKRIKIQENNEEKPTADPAIPPVPTKIVERQVEPPKQEAEDASLPKPQIKHSPNGEAPSEPSRSQPAIPPDAVSLLEPTQLPESVMVLEKKVEIAPSNPEEKPKPMSHDTPGNQSQEYNFSSMFAAPTGDENGNDTNLDLPTNLNADSFTGHLNESENSQIGGGDNPNSLTSLLPGLETYANQTGEDMMMDFSAPAAASGTDLEESETCAGNIFDLPEIGEGTYDFLNDGILAEGGTRGMGNGVGDGDDLLNDESMMDLGDLDTSFFN